MDLYLYRHRHPGIQGIRWQNFRLVMNLFQNILDK